MEKTGEIVECRGTRAIVRIYRTSSCCENCAECAENCRPGTTLIEAYNNASAKVGDTVKVQMNSGSFLFLAVLGYILPIIICITTYIFAEKFTGNILIADLCVIFSIIVILTVFFLLDKLPRKSTKISHHVIKVIN